MYMGSSIRPTGDFLNQKQWQPECTGKTFLNCLNCLKDWHVELYTPQRYLSKIKKKLKPQSKQKLRKIITASRAA